MIGLQTAITLLEAGAAVTIVAKHVPGDKSIDYTSPWYVEKPLFQQLPLTLLPLLPLSFPLESGLSLIFVFLLLIPLGLAHNGGPTL